ncbi:uncharacterized protein LOC123503643 [Portunus trituberculatus]|uniref:uncharacterized protein LOC123503643 n=1 Tax=Portunus trituberculatus TaxID=210409 RepID=UPI001E1D0249|nr:uncharacterized protein LOC123503643 [Portunus trituberculatus]
MYSRVSKRKWHTHTLLHSRLWRSSGTLHTAFINVCAECKTERSKDGGCFKTERDKDGECFNIHSIIGSGFLVLWKVMHTVLTEGLYFITHIDRLCHCVDHCASSNFITCQLYI